MSLFAFALFATPVAADKSKNAGPKTVRSISIVAASGRSSSAGVPVRPRNGRAAVDEQVSGFLQAASDDRRSSSDRSDRREPALTQQARIIAIENATNLVNETYSRVNLLHQQYDLLSDMTPEEIEVVFPDGSHLEVLQNAAREYNAAVAGYYRAVAHLDSAKSQLTGGQELNGSVLTELNALLGQ